MNNEYSGPERRKIPLSEAVIEEIAEKAADKAVEKITSQIYKEVGKSVISRFFYIVGVISVATYLWLRAKGVV